MTVTDSESRHLDVERSVEVKCRAAGFAQGERDILIVKADRQEPRLRLAAEIAKRTTP